jgi:cytochrome b561
MLKTIHFNKTKTKLCLDIALTAAYVIAMEPRFTGETWHEWLGLALGGAAIIHVLLNWKWVLNVTRRFFHKLQQQVRIDYLLDLALFASFTVVILSGIMISENLRTAETLGISFEAQRTWRSIHAWAPQVALVIVGIHLGLHWKWIADTTRRYLPRIRIRRPVGQLPSSELHAQD